MDAGNPTLSRIPSVDEVLKTPAAQEVVVRFGRPRVVESIRHATAVAREALAAGKTVAASVEALAGDACAWLEADARPNARPVFNLTGTVLHTNLGRAIVAEAAVEAATLAMREAIALEFDLAQGKRGERDNLVRSLLCELTGAEDATVVNNNAAAVLLALNTLAKGKEAIVSRGELIEIGGAFRMPEIMARAGTKLVEVGTTNRTHEKDYAAAINPRTGLILKVHTSNYRIEGFTKSVSGKAIAALAHASDVPLLNDLGSGTLVDLAQYGLTHEQTVSEAVAEGADLVTFSGDKLLGGPQAGFIVGRKDLVARLNRNPMKRALRVDKIRLAAIEATLRLYRDPDRLAERLPTLRMMARPVADIEAAAQRLLPAVATAVGSGFAASVIACTSQIGSGSLPAEVIQSAGIALRPAGARSSGRALTALADGFRTLERPVIGRVENDAFVLDLRCLEDEAAFVRNLATLRIGGRR
ncbi:L-seryl-tRNA(Sec) selenium transferase [Afipia carboxidovorans]|uniref:L-seryl-tRNA(Sec) selenium transferase n=1 Tax=Afipia carboxidovorans TaxID=40137 RepID=UPI003085852E|nr:L-seryl-tRNA(Sec) selenium transferase [Afipia carboxidovorans]